MQASSTLSFILVILVLSLAVCSSSKIQQSGQQKEINLADPTVFLHDGTYYLYGTVEGNSGEGFLVYTSKDLKNWEGSKGAREGFALRKGDSFGTQGFWAPQVFRYNNKFYMAYTANENIAIATSNSPLGPFTQETLQPLAAPVKQIDPFVFIDDDGKMYLYHVRLQEGNRIFVAELEDDLSKIKEQTLQECIMATEPWENTANVKWSVAEGPTVLKHKGAYYLTYSANDFRNPNYAVGYAISSRPTGPWLKSTSNPIISTQNIGENGTGHVDIVKDKKGDMFYVFHTHQADSTVGPRKTAVVRISFKENQSKGQDVLTMEPNTFFFPKVRNK
ncbi:glycoside hydrolase family 43 protein [Pontibacter harenae]|uniref:glycoside hydrolase family 43 protein n=1 Tax=Pontibacter harenae TaxID=2894083 RepID=UPI001E5A6627|nr:glycoside hydrolase family 43 protein [Pontibacter harenae]MCC9167459.1 glycoside hydrolase family 43 protein [Pontibacter harenae]